MAAHQTPPIPRILQARILEWVAISFSNAWKWKGKGKSLSPVRLLATPWTAAFQSPPSMEFSRQEYWSGVPLPSLCSSPDVIINCLLASFLPSRLGSNVTYHRRHFYSFIFFYWRTLPFLLLYSIIMVSAIHQHELAIGIHMSPPS